MCVLSLVHRYLSKFSSSFSDMSFRGSLYNFTLMEIILIIFYLETLVSMEINRNKPEQNQLTALTLYTVHVHQFIIQIII